MQIIVVEPKVSTAFIFRTMAFCLAIFRMPIDNDMTRMIGNPSGTIATKITTEVKNCSEITSYILSSEPSPHAMTTCSSNNNAAHVTAIPPRNLPNECSLTSSGVLGVVTSLIPDAMPPRTVFIPTRVTIAFALPLDATVPINAIFDCSCKMESTGTGSVCL